MSQLPPPPRRGAPSVRPRLAAEEVDALAVYLLRRGDVFQRALSHLEAGHFHAGGPEASYYCVWSALADHHRRYREAPTRAVLLAHACAWVDRELEGSRRVKEDVGRFLTWAWSVDPAELPAAYGLDLLGRFLEERAVADQIRGFWTDVGRGVPADLGAALRSMTERHQRVQAARADPIVDLEGVNWEEAHLPVEPTGVSFLDAAMEGGRRGEEVYTLLGTEGSGKTTLCCQLCACVAQAEHAHAARGATPRHVFYFAYETPAEEIWRKALSCAGLINKRRLDACVRPPEGLDGREREGYLDAAGVLGRLFHVGDMRGSRQNPRAGVGYFDEVVAFLDDHARRGRTPTLVVFDYALVMVQRHLRDRGLDQDKQLRFYLGSFVEEARRAVGNPYGATVVAVHQLRGQANRLSPGARQSRADASECSTFSRDADFNFNLGNKDRENGCLVMTVDKTRRGEGLQGSCVLQITERSSLICADDRFMADARTRRIVLRDHANRVEDAGQRQQRAGRWEAPATWQGDPAAGNEGDVLT